ncbi:PREDICTED: uncharacterized protein LOC102824287 [Chrysochloris asiatica]|uniref:Uncharacterized protein LOC102824287 n=1 Tax=Chrysochloris asiatica TaxID=185453 RepID=A0A9B0T1N2_CHRAS|nr:PREDICTED: uncharacterized protein LOC102824287 [Chrysochloris asiatica]
MFIGGFAAEEAVVQTPKQLDIRAFPCQRNVKSDRFLQSRADQNQLCLTASSEGGEDTSATRQGVMKRQLEALLGILCVQVCWVRGIKVEQSPSDLSLQEGTSSTLRCNYSSTVENVQWFWQKPGEGLIRLFYMTSGMKQNGRLQYTMNSKERYSTLTITASQLEDSATYLCAVEAQCSQLFDLIYLQQLQNLSSFIRNYLFYV